MLSRRLFLVCCTACALPWPAVADDSEREINALILAIEQSGCQFIRNGDSHSAAEAAEHLRLKYRKGKAYAKTAEEFIDNLASQSSLTKSPYYLITPQGEKITSQVWLQQELKRLRAAASRPVGNSIKPSAP
ncbi:MAG TPA: DUF5329 domain-containing protein [Cellvibrionaceae bacterium]|nr:DUF5329 domain-containing protein [Cellvibrionaceae bacterium]